MLFSSVRHGIHFSFSSSNVHQSEIIPRTETRSDVLGVREGQALRLHEGRLSLRAPSRRRADDLPEARFCVTAHPENHPDRNKLRVRKKRNFDAAGFRMCLRTLDSIGVGEWTRRT
jgi:hypothetical protein